jgi:hypothetical protein
MGYIRWYNVGFEVSNLEVCYLGGAEFTEGMNVTFYTLYLRMGK